MTEVGAMSTDEIVDAWAPVLDGAPLTTFTDWLGRELIRLEAATDEATQELVLAIRLVLAEMTRGDLDQAAAIGGITKLVPATANRSLWRSVGDNQVRDSSREDLSTDSRTQVGDLILAGS
jgi:hypothetical protein